MLLTLLLACGPSDPSETDAADTDPVVDTDTEGAVDADADGSPAGDDCNDADANVFPGAYDLPNDGVDGDCDGLDRAFDGIVVVGGVGSGTFDVTLPAPPSMDIAFVMDTSCASTDWIRFGMHVPDRAIALGIPDAHWGVATFEDYPYGGYGAVGYDLPFRLDLPLDADDLAAEEAIRAPVHSGMDGPEAGLEALYQALTGAGYDLGCDGVYDATLDIPAFTPSVADPFAGTGPASWSTATAGSIGGMGFRDGAVPVVLYVTDNYMRDADWWTEVPGGCAADAGAAAVISAANALDAWLVAGFVSDLPRPLMRDLADGTGSLADLDADGIPDRLILDMTAASGWEPDVDGALAAIAKETGADGMLETVAADLTDNPDALAVTLTPDALTDVDARATPVVTVEASVTAASEAKVRTSSITVEVKVEGVVVATETIPVEIAPL